MRIYTRAQQFMPPRYITVVAMSRIPRSGSGIRARASSTAYTAVAVITLINYFLIDPRAAPQPHHSREPENDLSRVSRVCVCN